jgi:putative membrane protein
LVGLFTSKEQIFRELSFFNLIFTFSLVLVSFRKDMSKFLKIFILIFILGYLSELIGVHTGYVFGNYSYGDHLGIKLLHVPLVIGINWAVLSIGAWSWSSVFTENKTYRIFIGGLLMLIFDLVMEPTAINLQYWKWDAGIIPLYNYISWFLISIPALYICSKLKLSNTGITKTVFVSQFIFFVVLSIKVIWF